VEHVKAERNVLAEAHNPFIVKLYYSFQVCSRCSSVVCSVFVGQGGAGECLTNRFRRV
jgi:hypothetical protein